MRGPTPEGGGALWNRSSSSTRFSAPPEAVQGEGRSLGRRCAFVRLGGCNLSCHWCDTPYTWDWTGVSAAGTAYDPKVELHRMPVRAVAEKILGLGVGLLVISGGEPMSQQRHLVPLVETLTAHGVEVEIETNGTRVPDDRLIRAGVRFNVSPKLAHTGDPEHRRIVPDALRRLAELPDSSFKFVCRDRGDLDEVAGVVGRHGIRSVWVMPEGQDSAQVTAGLRELVDAVIDRGWNITTRLHVLAWESRRGV